MSTTAHQPSRRRAPVCLRVALVTCELALACFLLVVETPLAAGSPSLSDPIFSGQKVDGGTISGRIVALKAGQITIATDELTREELPLGDLVKLARDPGTPPQTMEGSCVLLAGGDRLMRVVVENSTETAIVVRSRSALGRLAIPMECVLGMVLASPPEVDALDQIWTRLEDEPRTTDVAWMVNGDRLAGGFLGLDDRVIKLQIEGKPVELDRTGVVAVGFGPSGVGYPQVDATYVDLTLADGSRLGVTGARIEKGQVLATTRFGQALRIPLALLVQLDPRTGSVIYLSERKPDAVTYDAYFGPIRPVRLDGTVEGHRFQLAGRVFERGLGTQSRTLLAYKLKPGDRRFQALVGVDDRAGPLGSVVFRVLTDRQSRITTPAMTFRDPPRPIDIDISQAKVLVLITEFGDRGDVRDLADWVEARIIR
ncbi:MAG: NPCBM/NEW2 domain-containing protein [Isosphaeraceae bacterium]